MNKELLFQIFKAPYNRQSFIDNVLLPTVQGKVDDLEIYDQYGVQEVDLTASEEQYAKLAGKYGEFTTRDEIGRTVELYEVILHDHRQVERSRVGIAALIKKQIIGNNAVLVNFAYENPQNRSWRFSFIAHDAIFSDGEMVQSETNPKRYTYVFGEPDETYRTALERFYTLGHEYSITVESIKDAFGVEAMSKAFFDEYRDIHYHGFVDYLTRSNFKQSVFSGDEKAIRDFVKKLLGRIVFLYFIQKKGWLGASNGNYKDGDKNFMSNFYKKAGANEVFYSTWLSKLFFDTLNNPRPNDAFAMPDGTLVMIPYLNGGLFEKESNKYDFLTFPNDLFSDLFEFFDQYNFTIYEDSPEEHTVAVDPEMLGHIFENLLEDNKDKGAFYTPKEIVHYMTQESLIEYLHTQIPDANRNELEAFVKNKYNNLSEKLKKLIDQKLDSVKICDPAIGSGAFPMGLLQEIFGIKERIAFELGYNVWSPATVKEHIIQNSIYGVDIEQGAVDIARLRFWLSLIVDEDMPKALPNLDYKIVVGNSLVSKFEDEIIEIDWDTDHTSGNLFEQEIIKEKTKLLQTISEKQKDFFTADNDSKPNLSSEIRKLKLEIFAKQLELMISNSVDEKALKSTTSKNNKPSKKQLEKYLETEGWKRTLSKINQLKTNDKPFQHFDWKLDFPEVLNPFSDGTIGFDIIIANPPYVGVKGHSSTFEEIKKSGLSSFFKGRAELFYFFFHLAIEMLKKNGVSSFITTNYFPTSTDGSLLRKDFEENTTLLKYINFNELKIFSTALGQHNSITFFKKGKSTQSLISSISQRTGFITPAILDKIVSGSDSECQYFEVTQDEIYEGDQKYIRVKGIYGNSDFTRSIFEKFSSLPLITNYANVRQGLRTGIDKITDSHRRKFNYPGQKGEGVFILSQSEIKRKNIRPSAFLKELYKNSNIHKYYVDSSSNQYLLYIKKDTELKDLETRDPNILNHLNHYRALISEIRGSNSESVSDWFTLDRPREESIFTSPKIVAPQRSTDNTFGLSLDDFYASADVYYIIPKSKSTLYYLSILLNSQLYFFWYWNKGKRKGKMLELYQKPLSETPVLIPNSLDQYKSYYTYLSLASINQSQSNDFILVFKDFKEAIDSIILETYFPKEFESKGIEIEKHAKELFVPIDGLSDEEKLEQIKSVYEKLREKKNPLRNQIKLMKIELKDLLVPILSV